MKPEEAQAQLHTLLKPGDTVYTILRHCSKSGMHRRISLLTGDMHSLDWLIVKAGWGKFRGGNEGLVAEGCGMDMGFALVYNLGRAMWPCGTEVAHGSRNGVPDYDGGYALKQRWV